MLSLSDQTESNTNTQQFAPLPKKYNPLINHYYSSEHFLSRMLQVGSFRRSFSYDNMRVGRYIIPIGTNDINNNPDDINDININVDDARSSTTRNDDKLTCSKT